MNLKAVVIKVLYPKETPIVGAPTWYVLATSAGKVVGTSRLPFEEGHSYEFNGDYSAYQGQLNFKFKTAFEQIPDNPKELLYYACDLTKGLGKAYANKIWEKFGEDYHARLAENCKTKREADLLDTLDTLAQDAVRSSSIAGLLALGATPRLAEQAFVQFGMNTLAVVRQNPYVLTELPGQSFATVDNRFREPLGIALDNPNRINAYALYTLSNLAEERGDTVIPQETLYKTLAQGGVPAEAVTRALESCPEIVTMGELLTTRKLHNDESRIAKYVLDVHNDFQLPYMDRLPRDQGGITLDDSQALAVLYALNTKGVSVINGGAGCGKTTIIKVIADCLSKEPNRDYFIAAFAGKAAARIREATGHHASTIHSLLGYIPEIGFTLGSLRGTSIIIDEASMVPASLIHELCKREPDRLILVGDEAQLPPVGAGAPFHDLVRHGMARSVTTCYRNAEAVYQAAYAVRCGSAPVAAKSANESFNIVGVRNPEQAQSYVESILKHMDFSQDIIIAPRNGTEDASVLPGSVKALNAAVLKHLGLESHLAPSARIICLKNDPTLNVWNGTTGVVNAVDIDGAAYVTIDDGSEVKLPKKYINESVAPAYALTIHKAQGSQYRNVMILCLRRDTATLLDRAMLYTAITRAKRGCCIVTDTALNGIVARETNRQTILQKLLSE